MIPADLLRPLLSSVDFRQGHSRAFGSPSHWDANEDLLIQSLKGLDARRSHSNTAHHQPQTEGLLACWLLSPEICEAGQENLELPRFVLDLTENTSVIL